MVMLSILNLFPLRRFPACALAQMGTHCRLASCGATLPRPITSMLKGSMRTTHSISTYRASTTMIPMAYGNNSYHLKMIHLTTPMSLIWTFTRMSLKQCLCIVRECYKCRYDHLRYKFTRTRTRQLHPGLCFRRVVDCALPTCVTR